MMMADVIRQLGTSQATSCRWCKEYGGTTSDPLRIRPRHHHSKGSSAPGTAEIVYHRDCAGTRAAIRRGTLVAWRTGGASGSKGPRVPTGRTSTLRVPESTIFRAESQ